ncbi:MAG: hypothetical protein FWE46_02875 [Coriobacteriia bacterium]|nr:hypothetical protein [Coriobacteriia bacterium]
MTSSHFIAALLGVVCGSIMIAVLIAIPAYLKARASKKETQFVENELMSKDMMNSFVALMVTFVIATIAIFGYHAVAPDTLLWFSVTMLIWYLAGFTVYAFQKIAKERKNMEKR